MLHRFLVSMSREYVVNYVVITAPKNAKTPPERGLVTS
ncbi:hypothetical protein BSU04_28480 [Caballeronia sordidicola]|uniref:Uncharacterized protein n=1 Tax=Caballeronia sordidicola TaxID=196367 RepID=A0A226WVE5_CABSO|nr:hypothetical protein BSU04_28480 [Caballeronia sordidicola]